MSEKNELPVTFSLNATLKLCTVCVGNAVQCMYNLSSQITRVTKKPPLRTFLNTSHKYLLEVLKVSWKKNPGTMCTLLQFDDSPYCI